MIIDRDELVFNADIDNLYTRLRLQACFTFYGNYRIFTALYSVKLCSEEMRYLEAILRRTLRL